MKEFQEKRVPMILQPTTPGNSPVLDLAWEQLQTHLQCLPVSFGENYPVRLEVRQSGGNDSYRYGFAPEGGFVMGNNPRSVLLGVYAYLRDLGFVFLLPGEGGTYVPALSRQSQLYRPETSHTASLYHRGVCIEGADSLENVLDFIDWLPKNGYNSFFVQFKKPDVFLERWYAHQFNPTLPAEELSRERLDAMEAEMFRAMEQRGLLAHRVGHGWTAGALGYSGHGWHAEQNPLAPEKEPLVAMIGGKRELFGGVPTNTNLCYSNPQARQALIGQVVDYARSHPEADYLHFWLADCANNLCECPDCASTTLSDQYVEILNELDGALTREGLATKIVFLLYQELLYAPVQARIANPDRFCLMFAPITRTFEKTYPANRRRGTIAPLVRNHFRMPETVEGNLDHYDSWKDIFRGDSFFYDYPLGRAHYGDFGYMKMAKVIYDDIHSLKALGSDGYMSCQELRVMCPTGFPNYVMGLSLLDETIPYETMVGTYFSAMFGKNWQPVVTYLEELSFLSDTDYLNGHGPRQAPEKAETYRKIQETVRSFRKTLPDLREDGGACRKNWDFLEFHGEYTIHYAQALADLCRFGPEGAAESFQRLCDYIRSRELAWQPRLDVYRVMEVASHYTGFPEPR